MKTPAMGITIRMATPDDAAAVLSIYAPYIENTSFTFETETPSVAAFAGRIEQYLQQYPWLVCEYNGVVAGYAYASRHRERKAYQWCTESSVYIHDDFRKKGIASALYKALFEILRKQGFHNVYAVINLPNEPSVTLHEQLGFTWFATYENVGFKLGRWKNVGWWRLVINEFIQEPPDPVALPALDQTFFPGLFSKYAAQIR